MSSTAAPYNIVLSRGRAKSGRVRAVAGACAGNLVEWYDFFVYAYTAIYFSSSFFPAERPGEPAPRLGGGASQSATSCARSGAGCSAGSPTRGAARSR